VKYTNSKKIKSFYSNFFQEVGKITQTVTRNVFYKNKEKTIFGTGRVY
jgi:hypothetical protein